MNAEELAKTLRNIGPKCSQQMIKAGIDSPEKLRKLGAKKAFMRMWEKGVFTCGNFHAAYLYALQGAIMNIDWRNIPEEMKEEFKNFTEQLRKNIN